MLPNTEERKVLTFKDGHKKASKGSLCHYFDIWQIEAILVISVTLCLIHHVCQPLASAVKADTSSFIKTFSQQC